VAFCAAARRIARGRAMPSQVPTMPCGRKITSAISIGPNTTKR
jgi:hypothetical protein